MNKQEIEKMLLHAERQAIYSFILAYAESNVEFCKHLKEALLPGKGDDLNKEVYQAKAEDCFDFEEGGRGWRNRHYNYYQAAYEAASRLDRMLSDADYLIEQGEYAPAAGIAMSVAEVIPRNYDCVDDSNGALGGTFSTATECLVSILRREQVSRSLKDEIYEWIKQEINNPVYPDYGLDSLTDVYEAACEELGETDEVLADLDKQLEDADTYQKEDIVLRKIRFMQSRDIDDLAFIEKHLGINAVRKIRFEQLMESGLYDEALNLARKGIQKASTGRYWREGSDWEEDILEIYLKQEDVKNILLQAEMLLCKSSYNDDNYYQIIKEYTNPDNWTDTLERILSSFEKRSCFSRFAADIMVEHQMWKRLFAYCKKGIPIANVIEQYEFYLKPYFEKEILDIYRVDVEAQALITHSSAYDRVAYLLKIMRSFSGGNVLVNLLVQKYRATYKRRKNMMAVLNDV